MESNAFDDTRYLIVTPLSFSLTKDNLYAVDDSWGYDLEAQLVSFPNLHIFAPFDAKYQQEKYCHVFSEKSTITFHPLPHFTSTYNLVRSIPKMLTIMLRNIHERDIVQSAGGIHQPLGALTLFLCAFMRHRNRILILDADVIGELEVAIRLEQTGMRKLFFIVMKHLMNFTLQFLITITPLSFVVGDSLYKRYSRFGNVKKIYASWISNENIISPNDLRTKIAATLNRSDLKLVFAGRLAHKKGPHIAIKVAAILAKKGIPITLDLYGSGPMQLELIALIESGGLADIVTRKGYINYDVFLHVLTGYDILLLPNLSGEQPRVLFDAMATGVLVVASDIVSLSDIIRSNYNGILCTPQNPDSFAAVIEHLFSNKKELEPLLYQGMLTARQNTIQSMHEKRKSVIRATFHGERSAAIDYE